MSWLKKALALPQIGDYPPPLPLIQGEPFKPLEAISDVEIVKQLTDIKLTLDTICVDVKYNSDKLNTLKTGKLVITDPPMKQGPAVKAADPPPVKTYLQDASIADLMKELKERGCWVEAFKTDMKGGEIPRLEVHFGFSGTGDKSFTEGFKVMGEMIAGMAG